MRTTSYRKEELGEIKNVTYILHETLANCRIVSRSRSGNFESKVDGCGLKSQCTQAMGNRRIRMSFLWRDMRDKVSTNLLSERGMVLQSRRPVEAESVLARLKHNWGFRGLLLRGKEKVEVDWELFCMAHNIAKMVVFYPPFLFIYSGF